MRSPRPPARWFTVSALSLVLMLGGGCVAGPDQAAGPAGPTATSRDTPPVLGADQRGGPLYGTVWQNATETSYLARLDPRTLLPVAGGRRLGVDRIGAWTTSPDRTVALFGHFDSIELDPNGPNVYVMDLVHMRQAGVIKAKADVGTPQGALWLGNDRVLLLGQAAHYDSVERGGVTSLVSRPYLVATILDVKQHRVIAQRRHVPGGEVAAVEPSQDGLVVLFQPADRIGTVEMGRVDIRGGLRVVRLDRVTAGFQRAPNGGEIGSRQIVPGLAVDTRNERAYVVAAGSPVAEVSLADLGVTYHSLTTPGRAPSVLGMVRQALAPTAAEAKLQSGPERHATWLGDGRLAVWGKDSDFKGSDASVTGGSKPSGLQVIDTRDWSVRTLDPGAGQLILAGDRLVTAGVTERDASDHQVRTGDGLLIRTQGTRRPIHLYAGHPLEWLQTYGRYVYVDLTDPNRPGPGPTGYAVIDARTGTVLGEHKGPMPDLLH